MKKLNQDSGFTLVEVVMVIVIMAIIAAVAMRSLDSGLDTARIEETRNEMNQLAEAISGNPSLYSNGMRTSFGYVGDVGALPANLDALTTNPGYGTWRGPYIRSDYSSYADDFKKDAWGQLYAYTGGVSLKSVGGTDTLQRVIAAASSDLTANTVTGTITDAAGNPPGDSATKVRIILSYPNGVGGTKDSTVIPSSGGSFSFLNCVPIGNRQIKAVNLTTADTVVAFISVFPKSSTQASLRLPGALWAAEDAGGGGGGSAQIVYVGSTASAYGQGTALVKFSVKNIGPTIIAVNSIKFTYSFTAYYDIVDWVTEHVVNSVNPWPGSNNVSVFSTTKFLSPNEQIEIVVDFFRDEPNSGNRVNMAGRSLDVLFSDGSSFTVPIP